MSGTRANMIKTTALETYGSELTRSSGSLKQAVNVNVDEDAVITPRRGFNDYGEPTSGVEGSNLLTSQIMEYKDAIIRQYNDKLEYEDSSNVFQEINGTFAQLREGYRTKWQEASSNLYFTTSEGIKKMSVANRAGLNADMVRDAGGLKAGYASGNTIPTVGGFLPPQSKVAYRVLLGYKDASNNLVYGTPSSRFVVTNYAETVETYETSSFTFDTNTGTDEITNGDHIIYTNSTGKYTFYFDTDGSATEPYTALTIGSTFVKISTGSVTDNNASLAAISANTISNNLQDVTVTLDGSSTVVITSTEEGDITGISDNAYDLDGNVIVASTSLRLDTATPVEGSTSTGASANIEITGVVPSEATTEYFYQVYRTASISTSVGLELSDLDPGDEANLVYESGLTSAEITAGEFVFTDTTPDSFRAEGAPLYTNAITGEGISQANEVPPIALDIELFRNYMFYGNTKQKHKLEFTMVSVDDFVSESTRLVIGNDEVTRYYNFVGESEQTQITTADYDNTFNDSNILFNSANDERKYYINFNKGAEEFALRTQEDYSPEDSFVADDTVTSNGFLYKALGVISAGTAHVFDSVNLITNIVSLNLHGFVDNDILWFNGGLYYVVNATVGTFQLSLTLGGSAISLTAELPTVAYTDYTIPTGLATSNSDWEYVLSTYYMNSNPFINGDRVLLGTLTRYVINRTVNTFELSETQDGSTEDANRSVSTLSFSSESDEILGATGYTVQLEEGDTAEEIAIKIQELLISNVDIEITRSSNVLTVTHTNNGYTKGFRTELNDNESDNYDPVTVDVEADLGTGWNIEILRDGTGELKYDSVSKPEGGDVLLSGLVSVAQSIDETARSLVKIISQDPLSPVNAYYLSSSDDLPGNILLEARSLEDRTFYISIEESGNSSIGEEFTPELPYSQEIAQFDETSGDATKTTITLNSHGYSNGDEIFVGYYKDPNNGSDPDSFSSIYTISGVTTNTFDIEVANVGASAFIPAFSTIFSADVESDNEELANRIYYSKFSEPEAVPTENYFDVGARDAEILRILALRDELYVLKEDGIYVVSGTSAPDWSVRLVDSTRILAPDSAVVLNNQIYCLTDQGIVRISGSSAAVISRGIENKIDAFTNDGFDFASNTFGIAYENDRAYIMFCPEDSTDDTATQAYRYNIFERTWTRWEYEATCGLALSRNNKLYVGNGDRNYISQERKNNDRTDHSDRNFEGTISSNGISETTIELSSIVNVEVGDVIVQNQEVSIYWINWELLKRMDAFDTGVTSPSGSTMYDSFYASIGDNIPSKMQALNDYLRTLDPTYITAKTFTFNNIRANSELLVTELNTAASLTTIKAYVVPYDVPYEAYIESIDQTRNTVTVHTERPFVEGSIEIYKGFDCTVEWNPQHFGDPSALKQIREVTIMFDQNNFYKATAKFASDASSSLTTVDFNGKGIGYWGDLPWGAANNYWGGEGNDIPFRNPVPRGKQKCRYLSLTFEHINAREYFRILGISGVVRAISSRGYGTLG